MSLRNKIISGIRSAAGLATVASSATDDAALQRIIADGLTVRAAPTRAESADAKQLTIRATISTETPVQVIDWERLEVIDEVLMADGARYAADGVPLQKDHSRAADANLGGVRDITADPGRGLDAVLHFDAEDPQAVRIWNKVHRRYLTDVSVGYRVLSYIDIQPGQSATVKGRQFTAGDRVMRVSTEWELREVSVVTIGADALAKMRARAGMGAGGKGKELGEHADTSAASGRQAKGTATMNKRLRAHLIECGMDPTADTRAAWDFFATLRGGQREAAETLLGVHDSPPADNSQRSTTTAPQAPQAPQTDGQRTQTAPEPQRQQQSTDTAGELERRRSIRQIADGDVSQADIDRAIDEAWTVERFTAYVLERTRASRTPPVGTPANPNSNVPGVGADRRQARGGALTGALLHRCAHDRVPTYLAAEQRAERERLLNQGEPFRGIALMDLLRMSLRDSGHAGDILAMSRDELIRSAFSTFNTPGIFTDAVEFMVIDSYMETEDTTRGWVAESDSNDFRQFERTRVGKAGSLKRLPRGGTAEHTDIGDETELGRIARFAEQLVMDEQDFINDRSDILSEAPQWMGAAAKRLGMDLVYTDILANAALNADGIALFDASTHANLGTSSTALAATTLQNGITAMAKQTQRGVPLNIPATHLIAPPDLQWTASILLASADRRDDTTTADGTANPLRNRLQLVVENRMGAAGVVDPDTETVYPGSATNWVLVSGRNKEFELVYRAGTGRRPTVRAFMLNDRGQYGMGWDIKHDIGSVVRGYRGAYKATGAA